jgi:hypothetical protein
MWDFRFYEASAQILPVLYLAVVVEYRLLREYWEGQPAERRAILATGAWVVAIGFTFGEIEALDVVSRGDVPAGHEPVFILTAYLLAFGMLVLPLYQRAVEAQEATGSLGRNLLIYLGGLAALFALLGVTKVLLLMFS